MDKEIKVGVIIIATGEKYHKYITPQINSIKENFKPSEDVTIFLFTDSNDKYTDKQFYAKDMGYPGATLWRFHTMLSQEKELSAMDYLYYIDVDMRVVNKVGKEVLGDLVATLHPGFINKRGTYDSNPASTAYVDTLEGENYYCGGFNGGLSSRYLEMVKVLGENTVIDHSNKVVALWHDESHLNRYLIDNPPTKILPPSYCYPEPPEDERYKKEIWLEKYSPKIYALNKKQRGKKVSIIIPCYKQAHFLHRAIESALAQTYANVEVIVIDDGSPDNASEVASRYPVTLIRQENRGLCAARNAGISIATGEFFLPLDADDTIDKDYLLITVPEMDDKNVGVVYTAMSTVDERYNTMRECMTPALEINLENLKHNNQLYICSLIRMEALKQAGGYNANMIHGYEDWNLWIDIAKREWKFKLVPLPLFNYMIKEQSMAVSAFYQWHKWNLDKLRENHSEVYANKPKNG